MSEYSSGDAPLGLTELEVARLSKNTQVLLGGNLVGMSEEESIELKTSARDQIAEILIDDTKSDFVAQQIIESHYSTEDVPEYSLYAYWSIIRRAKEMSPNVNLPSRLITFMEELAQNKGETDIAFQLLAMTSGIDDIRMDERELLEATPLTQTVTDTKAQLELMDSTLKGKLVDSTQSARSLLDGTLSPSHSKDSARLAARAGRPTELFQDIQNNRFTTAEGLAAAKTQQDSERLAARAGRPTELRQDLIANRFLTPEGIAEARRILGLN